MEDDLLKLEAGNKVAKIDTENKLEKFEEGRQGYVINIRGGGKNREIRLSSFMFNFGIFSLIVGVFLLVGTCGFSIYSALNRQQNLEVLRDAQRAAEMQQEQLLSISKKVTLLSEALQNLAQQEEELRIQAGLDKPALEDKIPESELIDTEPDETVIFDSEETDEENPTQVQGAAEEVKVSVLFDARNFLGQGGPNDGLHIYDISEALTMIEKRIAIRLESLTDFQNELKLKREQMYVVMEVPEYTPEMVVIDGGVAESPVFDLSQFSGVPSANPNMPSIWPTNGVVSSPYGLRWGGTDFHPGIDIADDMGTPIVATADGVVEYAGWNSGGYGNMVDIDHGNGIMTRYGHASQVVVTTGQYVKRGQLIAYMGSTGFSTGPHVHYEIHVNGQRVNPVSYL